MLSVYWNSLFFVFAGEPSELSDAPSFVLPKLCLLFAVLEALHLPRVLFQPSIGSCAGVLVAESLWPATDVEN